MTSGVYRIVNSTTNDFYVGSSNDIDYRWYCHRVNLELGVHDNIHLQRAWSKFGRHSFLFEILEECDRSELLKIEQKYLDELQPRYNICRVAGRPPVGRRLGQVTPQHVREKQSRAKLGKVMSNEFRARMSLLQTGRRHSDETREKIRQARLGRRHSEESRELMSQKHLARRQREYSIVPGLDWEGKRQPVLTREERERLDYIEGKR